MDLPECCGKKMKIDIETPTHIELRCSVCGDVVYIKKHANLKPQLIDD